MGGTGRVIFGPVGQREPLSVTVITLDEERNLARCLESVRFAEEILVVDAGSTDRTGEVARRYGARFVVEPWRGYAAQRNLALSLASSPWVLVLDADEWLGPEGAEELERTLASPRGDAYAFRRLNAFSGGFVTRALSPDWQIRLSRRGRLRFVGEWVHEQIELAPGCRVERLGSSLYHLTYRSLGEYVARMNRYTDLSARSLRARRRRAAATSLVAHALGAFLKPYVLRGGFLDGMRGLILSVGAGYSAFLKYAKLWELDRAPDPAFVALVPPTPEDPSPGLATQESA